MTIRIAGISQLRPAELKAINMAVAYVYENYRQNITAMDLCDHFSISSRKLHLGIKQTTGQNLHEFIIQVKLDQAKLLLHDLDLSIKEISGLVGFAEPNYFSKVFRKRHGKTPGEYRSDIAL